MGLWDCPSWLFPVWHQDYLPSCQRRPKEGSTQEGNSAVLRVLCLKSSPFSTCYDPKHPFLLSWVASIVHSVFNINQLDTLVSASSLF